MLASSIPTRLATQSQVGVRLATQSQVGVRLATQSQVGVRLATESLPIRAQRVVLSLQAFVLPGFRLGRLDGQRGAFSCDRSALPPSHALRPNRLQGGGWRLFRRQRFSTHMHMQHLSSQDEEKDAAAEESDASGPARSHCLLRALHVWRPSRLRFGGWRLSRCQVVPSCTPIESDACSH